jgi:membrane protease YdiL (CAAX protease family)
MNYKEPKHDEFVRNEKFSNVMLMLLLLVRLIDNYLAVWIFGEDTPIWFQHWYAGIAFILTATIVWLNRHRLAALNIDRPFIVALIIGGVLYTFYLRYGVGIFVGIAIGLIFLAYQTNQLVLSNPVSFSKATGLLMFLTVLLPLVPVLFIGPTLKSTLDTNAFTTTLQQILITDLAAITFEEVLFRGALWAYIISFGLSARTAFYTTAVFYWISHHRLLALSTPYSFWVSLPIQAILLGIMTWRSKSLTPSTISHFLFNFISQLLLISFI